MRSSRSASTLIYNASGVVNFAQGEFVMIGGMSTVFLFDAGAPLWLACAGAIVIAMAVGYLLNKFAIQPARGASVVALIIITIGASIFLRKKGVAQDGKVQASRSTAIRPLLRARSHRRRRRDHPAPEPVVPVRRGGDLRSP